MSPQRGRRRRRPVDRGPRPLSEALDEALTALAPPRGTPHDGANSRAGDPRPAGAGTWTAVFAHWEEVVGAPLARHLRPLRVDGAVLVVAVDRPPWATQAKALAPQILARVAELGVDRPERLDVVVRPER